MYLFVHGLFFGHHTTYLYPHIALISQICFFNKTHLKKHLSYQPKKVKLKIVGVH